MQIVIQVDARYFRRCVLPLVVAALVTVGVAAPFYLNADQVKALTVFTSGTTIKSADVNANFAEVKRANDDNFARIGDLTALGTVAKTSLVAAVNELKTQGGTQGPAGPAGPVGPNRFFWNVVNFGGGFPVQINATSHFASAYFGSQDQTTPFITGEPAGAFAGRPFTFRVRFQSGTADITGTGNVMIDLRWSFALDPNGGDTLVNQTTVGTAALTAGVTNDVTVTINGMVPLAPPDTGGGTNLQTTSLLRLDFLSNAASTATGSAWIGGDLQIFP